MWISQRNPILVLAPMADMTDSPFCRVCRETAGNGLVIFREMVSSEALIRKNAKTLRMCEFHESERPIVMQIFGADAKVIRSAARIVVEKFRPDGIDINMGCPAPKIAGRAGAALMKDSKRAAAIVRELKKENLGVPITVKTRLGWSKEDEILEFAPALEDAGADAITIHGRTKQQGYSGKADWEMIGKVKQKLKIPVIANGDIASADDIRGCLNITGANGVMIGRGALGNPWIFSTNSRPSSPLRGENLGELICTVLRHAELHVARYGERGMVTFRKHLVWYFKGDRVSRAFGSIKELRSQLMRVSSLDELKKILQFDH